MLYDNIISSVEIKFKIIPLAFFFEICQQDDHPEVQRSNFKNRLAWLMMF